MLKLGFRRPNDRGSRFLGNAYLWVKAAHIIVRDLSDGGPVHDAALLHLSSGMRRSDRRRTRKWIEREARLRAHHRQSVDRHPVGTSA
jgi:hypothetical protein